MAVPIAAVAFSRMGSALAVALVVAGFAVVVLAGAVLAFRRNEDDGRDYDRVRIWRHVTVVEHRRRGRPFVRRAFLTGRLRVRLQEGAGSGPDPDDNPKLTLLDPPDSTLELAGFLPPRERRLLAKAVADALRSALRPPPQIG